MVIQDNEKTNESHVFTNIGKYICVFMSTYVCVIVEKISNI